MTDKSPIPRDQIIGVMFWRSVRIMIGIGLLVTVVIGGGQLMKRWLSPPSEEVIDTAEVDLSDLLAPSEQPKPVAPVFRDVTQQAGIDFSHYNGAFGERLLPETMGGGVAFFDFNNDGHQDLLFVNGTDWPFAEDRQSRSSVVLFANDGQGRFADVTGQAGLSDLELYGMGVAVGDYNGDGWVDLYITAVGQNHLLANEEGVFVDVTESAGVAGGLNDWSTSAAFFDANQDGHLDLYVANYVVWSREIDIEVDYRLTGIGRAYGPPSNFRGTQPLFFINQGDGSFVEMSETAGLHITNPVSQDGVGKGLAVIPVDIDHDGLLDLVVANDTTRNFVYLNRTDPAEPQKVRFEELGTELGLGFDRNGMATGAMGIDFAHFNNNDELAIAIGNFANEMSSFYVSQGTSAQFNDQSIGVGIGGATRLALTFGVFFFDYDSDGRLDYLQTNGHVENEINRVQSSQLYQQPAQLFWNCGNQCDRSFVLVDAELMGPLAKPIVGRGAAYADIDQDGRLDVVLTQINGPPLLLKNETQTDHHWVGFELKGRSPNPQAIGARVEIEMGDSILTRHVMPTRSYLSQVALPVHFGLGTSDQLDSVTVIWPDGHRQAIPNVEVDQYHVIRDLRTQPWQ